MKNNPRSNLQEKFSTKRGKFKPETDVEESSTTNYLDNIKAQLILEERRLETDDNKSLQTTCKLIKPVMSTRIDEQLSRNQSGSVQGTTIQTLKDTEYEFIMKLLYQNLRPGRLKRPV